MFAWMDSIGSPLLNGLPVLCPGLFDFGQGSFRQGRCDVADDCELEGEPQFEEVLHVLFGQQFDLEALAREIGDHPAGGEMDQRLADRASGRSPVRS